MALAKQTQTVAIIPVDGTKSASDTMNETLQADPSLKVASVTPITVDYIGGADGPIKGAAILVVYETRK